jgi:GntR family transcriptional regulator
MAVDPTPLYHKVYLVLREQILDHKFVDGTPMPSELELARAFSVSRVTLRKALEVLERDALILRQRGRGTFATPPAITGPVQGDISGLVENLITMGLTTKVVVLEFEYTRTPPDVAAEMGVPAGTLAQRTVRVRSLKGKPFSYAVTYVREDVGRTFDADKMASTPLLRLFEMAKIKISGAEQRISAIAADYTVAKHLAVDVGAPLLSIKRVVRDEDNSAVEHIRVSYRPDMYEFELNLSLADGPNGTLWHPAPSL